MSTKILKKILFLLLITSCKENNTKQTNVAAANNSSKKTELSNENRQLLKFMIKIYTDGACKGNPGVGGWGALILKDEKNIELFGGERETTNNRMELMAVIMALKEISSSTELTIYTDSTYVQKGISEWIKNWKMNNWRSSSKKPVKNKDLWIELDEASASRKINWEWVKGHAGNEGNEKADELANKGVISMMDRI